MVGSPNRNGARHERRTRRAGKGPRQRGRSAPGHAKARFAGLTLADLVRRTVQALGLGLPGTDHVGRSPWSDPPPTPQAATAAARQAMIAPSGKADASAAPRLAESPRQREVSFAQIVRSIIGGIE